MADAKSGGEKAKRYNARVKAGKQEPHSKGGPKKAAAKKGSFQDGDAF